MRWVFSLDNVHILNAHTVLQVFKNRSNDTQYLYDYCDGEVYKNHAVFRADDSALQIVMYTDEIETANPLGSYRGHHKLSNHYICMLRGANMYM